MKTTHNQALEIFKAGDVVKAYNVAMTDEGIDNTVSIIEWAEFASKCLEEREIQAAVNTQVYIANY